MRRQTNADRARNDDLPVVEDTPGIREPHHQKKGMKSKSLRLVALEAEIKNLQREYSSLLTSGPSNKQDDKYMLNVSRLVQQIEEAELEVTVERNMSESQGAASPSEVSDLQSLYDRLYERIQEIQNRGPPSDEDGQLRHFKELSSLTNKFDQVQRSLEMRIKACTTELESDPTTPTASEGTRQSYSITGTFVRVARYVFGAVTHDSASQQDRNNEDTTEQSESVNIESIHADLDAVRRPSPQKLLPLGMSYPTDVM